MYVYKFTVEATRERFMEPPLHDVSDHYVAAYDYDQAHSYVWSKLSRVGWNVQSIRGKEIWIQDIRDKSDHVTD